MMPPLPEQWRQVIGDAVAYIPHDVLGQADVSEKLQLIECLGYSIRLCNPQLQARLVLALAEISDICGEAVLLHPEEVTA